MFFSSLSLSFVRFFLLCFWSFFLVQLCFTISDSKSYFISIVYLNDSFLYFVQCFFSSSFSALFLFLSFIRCDCFSLRKIYSPSRQSKWAKANELNSFPFFYTLFEPNEITCGCAWAGACIIDRMRERESARVPNHYCVSSQRECVCLNPYCKCICTDKCEPPWFSYTLSL